MSMPWPATDAAAGLQAALSQQLTAQTDAHMALPPLREDLVLHPAARQQDGSPAWMVEDPLKARYYRIGWLEFEVLQRWPLGDARAVARRVAEETLLQPTVDEVLAVRQFLLQHELLSSRELIDRVARGEHVVPSMATQALHHYLMFRIPLFNPDRFLQRCLPAFAPLLGRTAFWISLLAGLLGLALVAQQWDSFATTFLNTLTLNGLVSYAVALVFAKILHELGHAFTAKKLGLRVPRMGVALVLMFPMLYTDTGETWRLQRRRDRFAIASAGIRIELMLAAWCTLAWSFLPDGALRSAVFYLGTTSWLLTLAINASPFMRFDGYFMMSDATGIPNLHEEAAKQVRHAVRRRLLLWREPKPLIEGGDAPRWLVWFGLATMVYRFFLFLGIAITVYHYFFKALGLFLFAVEIWWFILRPLLRELHTWWRERERIAASGWWRLGLLVLAGPLVLLTPWQTQVHAEGWLRAAQEFTLYPARPARLESLPVTGQVVAEQSLAKFSASDLALRQARANARIEGLDSRMQAGLAEQAQPESQRSTREQRQQQMVDKQGAGAEAKQLLMTAPFAGQMVDVAHDVATGLTLSSKEVLGRVIDPSVWLAEVFVDEDDVQRVKPGALVRAYLHGVDGQVLQGQVQHVDSAPVEQLPTEMLAAPFGGRLLTVDDANTPLKPKRSLYRLRVALSAPPAMQQARLAAFAIQAQRVSLANSLWRGAVSTLMLQASF